MSRALTEAVIEWWHRRWVGTKRARHITIDLDPTGDPPHGSQKTTFFNSHYDTWRHLPVAGFPIFNREPGQYLFAHVRRPTMPRPRGVRWGFSIARLGDSA